MTDIIAEAIKIMLLVVVAMIWGYAVGHHSGYLDGYAEAEEIERRKRRHCHD